MPDCDYCEGSFSSEKKYLKHLKKTHEGELSRVDQRRIDDLETEREYNTGALVLIAVVGGAFLIAVYVAVIGGGMLGGEDGPYGDTHEHGTMELIIDGEAINLDASEYAEQDPHFHFHGSDQVGDSDRFVWHTHSFGVTIQYALETLGIQVDDEGTELAFGGETFRDDDPDTSIEITVDNEPVNPGDYELEGTSIPDARQGQGDNIRIVVSTDDGEE